MAEIAGISYVRRVPRVRFHLGLAAVLACAGTPERAGAQCPNGSPPPCSGARPVAVDPNRVVFVPFRVSASDTLLGEGFAELLAAEFTGQGMPASIDMGAVLQAWRRAGGGLRSALSRRQTLTLARNLGAGIVSDGSIVGFGQRVTINVALRNVNDGSVRGSAARITTTLDSLDHALRLVSAILTATVNAAGAVTVSDDVRYTKSPEALRQYLEGMALWRRGKFVAAAAAWDRAIALDSLFARAMYRRHRAQTWEIPGRVSARRVHELRDRLALAERIIVVGQYGEVWGAPRSVEQRFADVERAVTQLPDNIDALYTAGDLWYHSGAAMDPARQMRTAVNYFERALAIDSQTVLLMHVADAAHRMADTSLARRVALALERTDGRSRWQVAWLTAARLGDERWIDRLRGSSPEPGWFPDPMALATASAAPAERIAEMFERWLAVQTDPGTRGNVTWAQGGVELMRGRPVAAESTWAALPQIPALAVTFAQRLELSTGGVHIADLATTHARAQTLAGTAGPWSARIRCAILLNHLRRDLAVEVDTTGFGALPNCLLTIELLRSPSVARLAELDSIVRTRIFGGVLFGYEAGILARAWERAGSPERALRAIRYRGVYYASESPWNYAEEGRLAAQLGDTTGAIRAYQAWLGLMRDAEPVYHARRDSVRAALARLRAP